MKNQKICSDVEGVITDLINSISNFPLNSLNTVPFEGSWTAAQVGDHLFKSYGTEALNGTVIPTERQPDEKVPMIKSVFLNTETKMNSPESIIPSSLPIAKETLLQGLEESRRGLTGFIAVNDLSLSCIDFVIPEFGVFTRLEWLHLLLYHTQRHLGQLSNIERALSERN